MSTKCPLLVLLVGVALASTALRAQQSPATAPPGQQVPPTFRAEVNYVEIDAVVTDAQGQFVGDLTRDDFQVVEDKKPQTISVFSRVDIPIERADQPLFATAAIPPDVVSNRAPFEGRVFVILMDDLQTSFTHTARVRQAARQFVERYVGANDRVAVVTSGGQSSAAQEFTSNKQLVLKAIDRFAGKKTRSATLAAIDDYNRNAGLPSGTGVNADQQAADFERAQNARNTLATIKNVADYMAAIQGRRKAVVLFSEGIDYDIYNLIVSDTTGMGSPVQFAADVMQETRDAIAAATRANVSIYGVDPRGLTDLGDDAILMSSLPDDNSAGPQTMRDEVRRSQDSLRVLSDETGGFAAVNQNDLRNAFARIQQDNSSYYVIGYYPANDRRDGRFRSISVRVTRPGLTVRARKGYVAPKGKAAAPKTAAGSTTSPELRDALASPLPVSGLTLSTYAGSFKGEAPNASVAISVEVDPSKMKFTQENGLYTDKLELSLFAADVQGKIRDGGRNEVDLKLRPQTYQAMQDSGGLRLMHRLALPPGRYQLRVGAREANGGELGSVIYDLDVPDFSDRPLTMSAIALTSASASRIPTANPDPQFKDVLPAAPAALREFPKGDTLALFTEVYDNAPTPPHRVAITATVLTDTGQVVFTKSDERHSEELQGKRGGYGYTTQIPTSTFAPGRYVLRVEAKSLAGKGEPVRREVEFRIR